MSLPTAAGSMWLYSSGSTLIALACRPALWANAAAPTYAWWVSGAMLAISAMACDTRTICSRQPSGRTGSPSLSWRFAHDREQVGVAGPLAVPVGGALEVRHPGLDRGDGVGDRAGGVVLAVDAEPATASSAVTPSRLASRSRTSAITRVTRDGSMPPLVSHRTAASAPACSAAAATSGPYAGSNRYPSKKCSQSRNTRRPSATKNATRVPHHRQVLLPGGPQRPLDVPDVGLGDQGHHRRLGVEQRAYLGVLVDAEPALRVAPNATEQRVLEVQLGARPPEELGVLGHGPRPAALDEGHPEVVEQAGDGELVDHRVA